MSERELEILQHALGLDEYGRGPAYRNHFVTDPRSSSFTECRALVERGLMHDHGVRSLAGGCHLFTVTAAGLGHVREHSPTPPKLTRGQRRYRQYLKADCGLSFGEWLRYATREPTP